MERKFNNIDKYATEIMLSCKNNLSPSMYGKYAWSTKLMEIGLRIKYINLLWLQMRKVNIPLEILEHAIAKANSEDLSTSSAKDLKLVTSQTREEHRKIQDRAKHFRESELQERVYAYIVEDKLSMCKVLKILIDQEQIRGGGEALSAGN